MPVSPPNPERDDVTACIDMLRVIALISTGDWDRRTLSQDLSVTTKTVSRHIKRLQLAGIPIEFDRSTMAYTIPGHIYKGPRPGPCHQRPGGLPRSRS